MKFFLSSNEQTSSESDSDNLASGVINGCMNTLYLAGATVFISSLVAPGIFSNAIAIVEEQPTQEVVEQSEVTTTASEDDNFEVAMEFVLRWEGGDVNNPADPGGLTSRGITAATARANGVNDPRNLTSEQVKQIYRADFWDKAGCGQYNNPLALVCMDTAVNFGLVGNGVTTQGWQSLTEGLDLGGDPLALSREIIERRIAWRHEFGVGERRQFVEGWLNRDRDLEQTTESFARKR